MQFNKPEPLNLADNLAVNFKYFKEEIQIYLTATETDTKKGEVQVARLKNLLGTEALRLYQSITTVKPEEETIEIILKILEDHCTPKKNDTIEIYKFFTRKQEHGEPFEKFYADLQNLIKSCEFDDQRDKLMKMQIIMGINSKEIQENLLREERTLTKIVDYCMAVELAEKNMQVISEGKRTKDVETVNKKGSDKPNYGKKFISKYKCGRCGFSHKTAQDCPANGKTCKNCSKLHHFAKMCKNKVDNRDSNSKKYKGLKSIEVNRNETDFNIDSVNAKKQNGNVKAWYRNFIVNGCTINFKIDTGAQVNILPFQYVKKFGWDKTIRKTDVKLAAFGGTSIEPMGTLEANISNNSKNIKTTFYIVKCECEVPLLGLSTCIELDCLKIIEKVENVSESRKHKFIKDNDDIFQGLGCFPDTCSIKLKTDAVPRSAPPRRVPLKIRERLQKTLKMLTDKEIIKPVNEPAEWVSNIVVVEKPNGSLRVCIDPTELNRNIVREFYTIPSIEEIVPSLNNKKVFCVFDLKDGFHQIKLDDESSRLCTFSTPYGCFRFLRAPFGLCSIPEIFQKLTQKYFGDIPGVSVYFDDILCSADNEVELKKIVDQVIDRAHKNNIKFNPDKLQYLVPEVKYFGFVFSEAGMRPDKERIKGIQDLGSPSNKNDLQKILGVINYLRNFIPNLSEIISPFRELLKNDTEWVWTKKHQELLENIKAIISDAAILIPFDPKKKIEIQCDASKDALGCCLFQEGKPVLYASRSLTETEVNYAQIEKELLSVVFACNKLHNYIYGYKVKIYNDHQPLISLVKKDLHKIKNNRLRRLRMKLLLYDLDLTYLPGSKMYVADLLSRNFVKRNYPDIFNLNEVVHTVSEGLFGMSDNKTKEFQTETLNDSVLENIVNWYQTGWPSKGKAEGELKHYYNIRHNITVENGLIYYDDRLIVPKNLRKYILNLIHETHLGMTKTKNIARTNLYWPGIMSDIESFINQCKICLKFSSSKTKEPLMSHEIPKIPFSKIGVDIANCANRDYLVMYDYYSKWLELIEIKSKDSLTIISKFKHVFSHFGIPKVIIADNMPFNSQEMQRFANDWNFVIQTSSPYHSRSNGLAEKAVGIAKTMLKKAQETKQDIELFLLNYRNATVSNLNYSPAQLNMNRSLRTKIITHPKSLEPMAIDHDAIHKKMLENQKMQKKYYDKHSTQGENFKEGDKVWLQDPKSKLWEKAEIVKALSAPRSFLVRTDRNKWFRRNTLLLKRRKSVTFEWEEKNDDEIINPKNTCQGPETYVRKSNRQRRPTQRLNL